MIKRHWLSLFSVFLFPSSLLFGQPYRCDWWVNGIGGNEISAGNYRCGATLGQTATGLLAGENLLAWIGFWQPIEEIVGIEERKEEETEKRLVITRFLPGYPNPFRGWVGLRYSLGEERVVLLRIYDLKGNLVRTLFRGNQKPGLYDVIWDGRDGSGRQLPSGLYFCWFRAGEYHQRVKLLLRR